MKIRFTLFLILSFGLLISCSSDDSPKNNVDILGNWKVAYFIENGVKITKTDQNTWPDSNDGDITANFSNSEIEGRGKISGITVTNSYTADYTINSNGQIQIGSITSTLITEPEWTRLYLINLAENFEIKNDQLIIYYDDRNISIVFERN